MSHARNNSKIELKKKTIMDDEFIELLLKHDTWFVPTLATSHLTQEQDRQ